jgi:hydroxyacylglutathione hydrolase
VTNLKFAARAEPSNEQVRDKLAWAELQQAAGKATVPSTLSEEKATNPFLRCREESLQQFTGQADVIQCLAAVRAMKTGWRPT